MRCAIRRRLWSTVRFPRAGLQWALARSGSNDAGPCRRALNGPGRVSATNENVTLPRWKPQSCRRIAESAQRERVSPTLSYKGAEI